MVATNRIADEHESLNRILQVAPYVPLSNIWFLWPYETVPKLHLDRFSHFVWFVLLPNPQILCFTIFLMGQRPLRSGPSRGKSGPMSNTSNTRQIPSTHANAHPKQHLRQFIRFCRAHSRFHRQTDRQTDRQINKPHDVKIPIATAHIYALHAMWANHKTRDGQPYVECDLEL